MVEVSADAITLRVGSCWLHFTASTMQCSDAPPQTFALHENGTVSLDGGPEEEMDLAAERLARAMMQAS